MTHQKFFLNIVNRRLARNFPRATTTNQSTHTVDPTGHQMSRPKMNENANFGQKFLIFLEEIKSFVTHITENPPRHLVRIYSWLGMGQNGQKMPIFGSK